MTYEEAVWKWVFGPANIDPKEMYLWNVRIEDIPSDEAEYKQQDPLDFYMESVYPGDGIVALAYGAGQPAEAGYALGGWVTTARQLLKFVGALAPPHCNKEEGDGDCLISEEYRREIEEKPFYLPANQSVWHSLGWLILDNDGNDDDASDDDDFGWQHDGGFPGSAASLIRMNKKNGYAYSIIFNGNNSTGLDNEWGLFDGNKIDQMAKCVDKNDWPLIDDDGDSSSSVDWPTIIDDIIDDYASSSAVAIESKGLWQLFFGCVAATMAPFLF